MGHGTHNHPYRPPEVFGLDNLYCSDELYHPGLILVQSQP